MSPYERGAILHKAADLIEKHEDELIALESMDNGKPTSIARAADFFLVKKTYRYYAGWPDKMYG